MENGSNVLEDSITFCNGDKCNPVRSFSAEDILKATNNFKSLLYSIDDYLEWYRSEMNGRPVLIKRFLREPYEKNSCRDIAISSMMSSHKNVLKLLGCCLEFPNSVLIYEDAEPLIVNKDKN